MRKKSCENLFDIVFWYVIYLLPLFVIILGCINGSVISIDSAFDLLNIGLIRDNIVTTTLIDLFGPSGVLPFFNHYGFITFISYFVIANILHLVVDILLFIVRWSHSLLEKGLGGVK